jgi:SAM-dependent methyltransferase
MPDISEKSRVLEIGASILSNVIKSTWKPFMETVYHELEPEWKNRFDHAGIHSYPAELLRDPLPVPDSAFDLILFDEVLEHFPVEPHFFLRQCIGKLKPDGQLILSVPNFATSQKRVQLLRGENPQDRMDIKYIYYAHHREPVMNECIEMVKQCGGIIEEYEWSDFDIAPGIVNEIYYMLRCLKHKMFHRIVHQLIPSTRNYLFLRIRRDKNFKFDESSIIPPLSISGEYRKLGNEKRQ